MSMVLLTLAAIILLAIDAGVTALAYRMVAQTETDAASFWISFWSGLAYSFWIATLIAIVVGLLLWRLQDRLRERWRRADERDRMMHDAIGVANGIYAEFPSKPVYFTNSETAARRCEEEHKSAQDVTIAPVLTDLAVRTPPAAARRIYRRIRAASPLIWSAGSPLAGLNFFLHQFVSQYEKMMRAARTLDYRLAYHTRRFNRSAADDIKNEADRCFYLGKTLGWSDEDLCGILAAEDPEEQRALPQRYERLTKVAALSGAGAEFAQTLRSLQNLLISLRDSPRDVPNDYKGLIPTDPPWSLDEEW